jgi:rod shape determining protein RodA
MSTSPRLEIRGFWSDFDWAMFGAALALSLIGLTEIYSATMNIEGDVSFIKQAIFICAGIALMVVVASVDYHTLSEHIPWIYVGSLAVLVYTPLAARKISGARSWIDLGPISIQPSELIKIVVVVALARYFADLHVKGYLNLNQIIKAAVICALPMGLILLQPDTGTALTYTPVLLVGLFLRGIKPAVIVSLILVVLLIIPISWFVFSELLLPHQKDRILTFFDPSREPLGKGYQIRQSKIAIGSGGLLGKGIFKGSQSQLGFLPARHTDFIFSVVGEEMGFVGVLVTLGLLGFILFRSLYNAQTARDSLGMFIVLGVVGLYFFHMVVNIAMVIGWFPVVGIPLPFLSYGGSAILTAFIGLGLVISVRRRRYVN